MARSVTYSVVPRRNPSEKGTPPKYYAQAQARGDVILRDMADRIQSSCTVHKSEVYAVLVALEDVVADANQNVKSSVWVTSVPFKYPSAAKVP